MLLNHLVRLLKFATVGVMGMVIDFGVTWLVKEKLHVNRFVANGLGFCCAVVSNFVLNRAWTFGAHGPDVEGQLARFVAVALIGLGLNMLIVYFFTRRSFNFYLSKAMAIVVVFVWNYAANSYFTFKS